MAFDPNGTGNKKAGIFSLPMTEEESRLVFIGVPWEVTTSYGDGCSFGPAAVLESSKQLDLCDALYGEFYEKGLFMRPISQEWKDRSDKLKTKALLIKETLESGDELSSAQLADQELINQASVELNDWLYQQSLEVLDAGKIPAVIGGDHSSPFGLIKALKSKHENLSLLHIDAHHDLRKSYQGYQYSHASIMFNVMEELSPHSLVQMGIRDFCPEEQRMACDDQRIHTYYDSQVSVRLGEGETWASIAREAISHLSDEVYVSFDIDGLSPDLCPNTGTPVPGGINFQQMESLLFELQKSNKKVLGFDLCEVSPEGQQGTNTPILDGWDGNVGARVLFKLAGLSLS
ncbi:MAG: agmatinase family protein [Pseudomonadota bacterium]